MAHEYEGNMANEFDSFDDSQISDREVESMNAIKLAILFHELYEKHAPEFGYETKDETKIFKANTPNGKLMIKVCREIQNHVKIEIPRDCSRF
jgi:hypothetical protein